MRFCPYCNNLLKCEFNTSLFLSCISCHFIFKLKNSIYHTESFKLKKIDKINDIQQNEKYGSKCTIKCPECNHNEAFFKELQTRSADEPMTIFYKCVKCKFNWKD